MTAPLKIRCDAGAGEKSQRRCRRWASWNQVQFNRTGTPMPVCTPHKKQKISLGYPKSHFSPIERTPAAAATTIQPRRSMRDDGDRAGSKDPAPNPIPLTQFFVVPPLRTRASWDVHGFDAGGKWGGTWFCDSERIAGLVAERLRKGEPPGCAARDLRGMP